VDNVLSPNEEVMLNIIDERKHKQIKAIAFVITPIYVSKVYLKKY
jgi:hypothetical protein